VNWAEPNYIYQYHLIPPDKYFPLQYGLHNTGQAPFYGTPGADIDVSSAWDINADVMPWINIAIIDTGIDTLHYDLVTQMWHNPIDNDYDGVNEDHNYFVIPGYPDTCWLVDDVCGWDLTMVGFYDCGSNSAGPTDYFHGDGWHATAVAGVAGASAYTEPYEPPEKTPAFSKGMTGVNWNSKLMSLKVSNAYYGPVISAIGLAIQYAADKNADVINMSFGGPRSDYLDSLLNYAHRRGCILVASMGNCVYGCEIPLYPASDTLVIAVGATNWDDNRWYTGPGHGSSYGEHIDVVAPGESVMTDLWMSWAGIYDTCTYKTGTSFSAPFVSGEAALIKGQYKKLYGSGITNIQIRDIIRYSAEDSMYNPVSDTAWDDTLYGYGRINAFRALLSISRGEVNNDHSISVSDVTYLIKYLMQGGPPPLPVSAMGDVDCSGNVSISDAVYLINYIFKGGPKPPFCYKWNY
jgi:subtilisin family serine protease